MTSPDGYGPPAEGEPLELHSHHCSACDSPWSSTHRHERACPFCGAAQPKPRQATASRRKRQVRNVAPTPERLARMTDPGRRRAA